MIWKMISYASSLVFWAGSVFVLCAIGIEIRNASRRYLTDSELLQIVTELTAEWKTKTKGYGRAIGIFAVCAFALIMFAIVPLQHKLLPAATMTGHYWFLPHVPEEMPQNAYVVLLLDKNDPLYGTRPRYTFCAKGQQIPFDEGELITDIVYKEHGDCKEILHFNLERDEHFHTKHYRENELPKEAMNHGIGR